MMTLCTLHFGPNICFSKRLSKRYLQMIQGTLKSHHSSWQFISYAKFWNDNIKPRVYR
jgi:hypothetical protein